MKYSKSFKTRNYKESQEIQINYGSWVSRMVEKGYSPFFMSIMFNRLFAQGHEHQIDVMHRDLERLYGRIVRRFAYRPNAPGERHKLPVAMFSPDLPVFKHDTAAQQNLGPNDGLHCHGICMAPPVSRFKHRLDLWVIEHQQGLMRDTFISRIHIQPIRETPDYMTQYALKSLGTTLPLDSVLILPRERGGRPNPTDKGYDEAVRAVQGASMMRTGRKPF